MKIQIFYDKTSLFRHNNGLTPETKDIVQTILHLCFHWASDLHPVSDVIPILKTPHEMLVHLAAV